jgi:hypothetical protein
VCFKILSYAYQKNDSKPNKITKARTHYISQVNPNCDSTGFNSLPYQESHGYSAQVQLVEALFEYVLKIVVFQAQSQLHCCSSCGACCSTPEIRSSPLEFLPWALHLFLNGLKNAGDLTT